MSHLFEFDAMIHKVEDRDGAYAICPYDGSIVNMGVKDEYGQICYIIGMLKSIRKQLNKQPGDSVHVVVAKREK